MGYKTCYYRTSVSACDAAQRDAYRRAASGMDRAIDLLKPGVSSLTCGFVPAAQEIGIGTDMGRLRSETSATVWPGAARTAT